MKRKDFLYSAALLGMGGALASASGRSGTGSPGLQPGTPAPANKKTAEGEVAEGQPATKGLIPPYLKQGDTIGIFCPAGFITLQEIQPAVIQMQAWGFKILIGDTVGKKDFSFGGTDEERANDFQNLLDNTEVKAIMCARGGYGFVRIIDRISFAKFPTNPKWVIGFSDVTVLHTHLHTLFSTASIHSKMCNSFPDNWATAEPLQQETIVSIRKALTGEKMHYAFDAHVMNRRGVAEGNLIGGNLRTIENMAGTASDFQTDGKILFVEDTGEYLYSIDRMFYSLKRTGKFEKLKGLIVGGFKLKTEDPGDEFGRTLYQIVLDITKNYSFPVCFEFPVGHQRNNFALKCGIKHRLEIKADKCLLTEV